MVTGEKDKEVVFDVVGDGGGVVLGIVGGVVFKVIVVEKEVVEVVVDVRVGVVKIVGAGGVVVEIVGVGFSVEVLKVVDEINLAPARILSLVTHPGGLKSKNFLQRADFFASQGYRPVCGRGTTLTGACCTINRWFKVEMPCCAFRIIT